MITIRAVLVRKSILLPILVKQVTVTTVTLLCDKKRKENEKRLIVHNV